MIANSSSRESRRGRALLLFIALLVVLGGAAGVISYWFPNFRYSIWGVRASYAASPEPKRGVVLSLRVMEGREVRGADAPDGPAELADSAQLETSMEETTLTPGSEFTLDYKILQVRSEQFAWNQPKPGKLSGYRWQVRVRPQGQISGVKLDERSNALWSREDVAWIWMASLWPELSTRGVGPGESWDGEVRGFATLPEKPEGFPLILRAHYTLANVRQESGKTLLEFTWTGSVSSDGPGNEIKGDYYGRAITSQTDRRCLISDFNLKLTGTVPVSGAGESMKLAWNRQVEGRIYRSQTALGVTPTPGP